jgi:L-threonylcarbamoyladenylate synthase
LNKFNFAEDAIDWLKQGKILLHPTEGVWGIGCDAFNASAVNKINALKQREA